MRNYLNAHKSGAFDEEETRLLCAAFDDAWKMVLATPGDYILQDDPVKLRETLASEIVANAINGERDTDRLRTKGLLRVLKTPMETID